MDILWNSFHNLIDFLAALDPVISKFLIRLGLWFALSYFLAMIIFRIAIGTRSLESLVPFFVFGLSTVIAFSLPLKWVIAGEKLVGYMDMLSILAIIALPREIPRMVLRRYGYQIVAAKLFYIVAFVLTIVQIAIAEGG